MTEMTPISAAEMRKIEQDAIASGRVTGLKLMERAGRGVVEAIFETWPELAASERRPAPAPPEYLGQKEAGARRAVVLCGPGNNGGDGFVVARLLAERGWRVDVFLYGDAEKLPPDARVNYERWCEIGDVKPLTNASDYLPSGNKLYIDALFGTGLSRPLNSETRSDGKLMPEATLGILYRHLVDCVDAGADDPARASRGWPPVVAVDLPSGISADTGTVLQPTANVARTGARAWCAAADLTVTFHRPKHGHVLEDGPSLCGTLVVKDIGL